MQGQNFGTLNCELHDVGLYFQCLGLKKHAYTAGILISGWAFLQSKLDIPQLPHAVLIIRRISLHDTPLRGWFLSSEILSHNH